MADSNIYTSQKDEYLIAEFCVKPYVKIQIEPHRVYWEKPPDGWIRLNIDGSFKGNPKPSGWGVIRDSHGKFIGALSKKITSTDMWGLDVQGHGLSEYLY